MRLDKFLKISRLVKRRPVANSLCDAGGVLINDRVAKASTDVKVGDQLTITMGPRQLVVKILQVPLKAVAVQLAPQLYEVLSETRLLLPPQEGVTPDDWDEGGETLDDDAVDAD